MTADQSCWLAFLSTKLNIPLPFSLETNVSGRTKLLSMMNSTLVHLKHLDVSKHIKDLSPASRSILLSGPVVLSQKACKGSLTRVSNEAAHVKHR
ncbi:cell division cycle ATPase [Artemisia annua]|uniref:Cell division cycle ATPase n=1 Tax=Artemisia annua TaxID=35608 RepID=A0A2U1MF58_ARTAN|nr:cell division cycle ATPase [Artemisia annua]